MQQNNTNLQAAVVYNNVLNSYTMTFGNSYRLHNLDNK